MQALSYLIGIYNKWNSSNLFYSAVWAHLFLLILICFDAYIQKLEVLIGEEIEKMNVFILKLISRNAKANKLDKILKSYNIEDKGINRSSYTISRKNSRASENLFSNYINNKELYKQLLEVSTSDLYENPILGENIKNSNVLKRFMRIFLKIDVKNRISKMDNTSEFTELNSISKLSPKNLYVSFFSFLAKCFEELIIFMLILSALFKMNIISIFYIILVFIFQIKGKNYKKLYSLSLIISSLIFFQTIMFLSNLSEKSDPNSNQQYVIENLSLIKEYLSIPWLDYTSKYLSIKMNFFLSFGENNYQVLILWLEFLIIVFIFIYFDNFCFIIYQDNHNPYAFINFYYYSKHEKLKSGLNNFGEKKFENLRSDLKNNFFIDLPSYNFLQSKINKDYDKEILESQTIEPILEEKKENFNSIKQKEILIKKNSIVNINISKEKQKENSMFNNSSNNPILKKTNSKFFDNFHIKNLNENEKNLNHKKNKKSKCYKLCEKIRKFMYLNMHNFTLIITLFLSLLNTNIISIIYIGFVIYNLNKSYSIKRKKNFTFPSFIKTKFRLVLIIDLFIQVANQIPFTFYNIDTIRIFESIGIYKLKTESYGKNEEQFNTDKIGLVLVKALTYLLLSIQVKIYCSNDFKDFYLKYIFKNNDISYKKAIFNSFLFNNRLIEKMKKSIKSRESIDDFLKRLENQIAEWSSTNILKKNSCLKMNNGYSILRDSSKDENSNFKEYHKEINYSIVTTNYNFNDNYENQTNEKEKFENQKLVENKGLINKNLKERSDNKLKKLSSLKNDSNNLSNFMESNIINKNQKDYTNNNNKDERISNVKDRLEAQLEDYFLSQNKTKEYFRERIYSLFYIDFINVFNRNTSNFIFMRKESSYNFEKCTLKGHSYYKCSLEERLDEEIEKINFTDITIKEIDIILNNIEKARKLIKKKISSKNKKKYIHKNSKGRKSKPISNISDKNVIHELNESEESSNEDDDIQKILKENDKIVGVSLLKFYKILYNNKIFEKYYCTKEILFYLFYHFFEFLLDNFQFTCFFFMILNNFMNGNILSLIWPFLVFIIGIIRYPRPSNIFWKTSMIYVSAMIMIKFILQILFEVIPISDIKNFFVEDRYRIGLKIFLHESSTKNFIHYFIWDCLLLLCLLIQQYLLISNGLWKYIENEIETMKEAHERIFKMQNIKKETEIREYADMLFDFHFDKMRILELKYKLNRSKKDDDLDSVNINRYNENTENFSKSIVIKNSIKLREENKNSIQKKQKDSILDYNLNSNFSQIKSNFLGDSNNEGNINMKNSDKINSIVITQNERQIDSRIKNVLKKSNSIYLDSRINKLASKTNSLQEREYDEIFDKIQKKNSKNHNVNDIKQNLPASSRKNSFLKKSNNLNERLLQIYNKDIEEKQNLSKEKKIENKGYKLGYFKKFYDTVFPRIRVINQLRIIILFYIVFLIIYNKCRTISQERTSMLFIVGF